MKLRNKKTGEIWELKVGNNGSLYVHSGFEYYDITSVKQLEAFDDYRDDYYFVDSHDCSAEWGYGRNTELSRNRKEIGNYFETREECRKAVEKLKAWKRLRDNGFEFTGWKRDDNHCGDFTITATDQTSCDDKDLDLLFGGEE